MKKVKVIVSIVLILAIVAFSTYKFLFPTLRKEIVLINDIERKFFYYVPANLATAPGVVFVFHGATLTPERMRIVTWRSFEKLADKYKNKIIVYPEGYKTYWNDCRKLANYEPKKLQLDEVEFVEHVIARLNEKFTIDQNKIFASGYSNGGQLCFKLAMQAPELFKGFAVYSANVPTESNNDCKPKNLPVSLLLINGTSDPINPYRGGEVVLDDGVKRGEVLSTEQSILYWLSLASFAEEPVETQYPDVNTRDDSRAVRFDYSTTDDSKKITLIRVENGGHHINNFGFTFWPAKLGNLNKDIDSPTITWEFFESLN